MNGDHMTGSVPCMFGGGNSAKLNTAVLNIFYRGSEDGIKGCCVIFKTPLHGTNTRGSGPTKLHITSSNFSQGGVSTQRCLSAEAQLVDTQLGQCGACCCWCACRR